MMNNEFEILQALSNPLNYIYKGANVRGGTIFTYTLIMENSRHGLDCEVVNKLVDNNAIYQDSHDIRVLYRGHPC